MSEDDARARVASQLPRELRIEHADFVIDNSRGLDALEVHVARAWQWIHELPDATPRLPT
jgi:dephospho-CoA kinase